MQMIFTNRSKIDRCALKAPLVVWLRSKFPRPNWDCGYRSARSECWWMFTRRAIVWGEGFDVDLSWVRVVSDSMSIGSDIFSYCKLFLLDCSIYFLQAGFSQATRNIKIVKLSVDTYGLVQFGLVVVYDIFWLHIWIGQSRSYGLKLLQF